MPKHLPKAKKYLVSSKHSVIISIFENLEGCSSHGRYAKRLMSTLQDRERSCGRYVTLPFSIGKMMAAEVFDGGSIYGDTCSSYSCKPKEGGTEIELKLFIKDPKVPARPSTPLSEGQRTTLVTQHLRKVLPKEHPSLSLDVSFDQGNLKGTCRFSGRGDLTIMSKKGPIVIGGTQTSMTEDDSPDAKGDCPSTSNVEAKLATNTQSFCESEMQLFANMHLSATYAVVTALLAGKVNPHKIERLIAYGTILKPSSGFCRLYKLLAPCNRETHIKLQYSSTTVYWHPVFNRILKYMCLKLESSDDSAIVSLVTNDK